MRDYDAHLAATYRPEPDDDDVFFCADMWCDGHALPSGTCRE